MEDRPHAPHVVFLKLEGHPAIVVGGGRVAERKVRALLDCGAVVTVVSPEVTPALAEMAAAKRIRWERRPYRTGDLEGMRIAYVTAGLRELNEVVRQDAVACGTLLNVADEPDLCDFFTSAVVRQGELTIAVSTNGASPFLARRIRERLGEEFGPEYAEALVELRRLREEAKAAGRPLREERERFEAIVRRLMDRE